MAARNISAENTKAAFRRRFRRESIGLIYSWSPGGEGRLVTEAEALRFVSNFGQAVDRAAIWFGRSVIASFALPIVLGAGALCLKSPALAAMTMASPFTWIAVFCLLRWQRWRWERQIWASVKRKPGTPALARSEMIRRGYSIALWNWLWILPTVALMAFIMAPGDMFPDRWRVFHAIARVGLFVLGGIGVAGALVLQLLRRRQHSR